MQRQGSAILLLAMFSFSLISPAAFTNPDSKLPACCRRDGQHHCSMRMAAPAESPSDHSMRSARCASFPRSQALPARAQRALPKSFYTAFVPIVGHRISQPRSEALQRFSFDRSGQKRGPPAFPLS